MKRLNMLLAIIIIFSSITPIFSESTLEISPDNIRKHLDVLSSEEFQGRMIGTTGNDKTIEYIIEHFEENGLKPIGDSFTHEFDALNIEYHGIPRFDILDSLGNKVLSLKEDIDYKIRLDGYSHVGSFKGDFQLIDHRDQIIRNEYNYDNLAILLDYENESIKETRLNEGYIDDRIYYKGARVLIYPEYGSVTMKNLNLGNKNVHLSESGLIKLGVNPNIYNTLILYESKGYKLDLDIPIVFNNIKSANTIGMIEGKVNNFNNIIIATSIDGLGIDANGNILPGVADNAAATSLLLELARVLSRGNRLDSNIIFLGLNGNKLGDKGFDNFFRINGIDPSRTQVIYLDTVGTKGNDITIGTFTNESTEFKLNKVIFNDLINTINKTDLDYNATENYIASDYINFRARGIKSFVISNGLNENIGTTNDNLDNVDIGSITDIGYITLSYLKDNGNMNILKEIWNVFKSIWYLVVIGIVLIIIYNSRFTIHNDKPIVSIYLILAFLIATFIIQTKHGIVLSQGILYKDTNIGVIDVLNTFGDSVFSTSIMFGYLCFYIFPLVIGLVVLKLIADRTKLSDNIFLALVCIGTILTLLYGFNMIYEFNYSSILPKILSLPKINPIVIFLIGLYNCIIIYILKKEINKVTTFKLMIIYILLNILLISAIYSPYIFNKTIINIRNTGGVIRF